MKRFEHVQFAARTDVGKKRKNNEDALGTFPDAGIFCVADGMGGGDDGEIASAAVVRAVEDVSRICVPSEEGGYAAADVADELDSGLNKASKWIFSRTAEKKLSGCGSTFVGVVLDATRPDSALAVHAGDSRLYLLRGRSIKQITRDHSVAEMLGAKDESKLNPLFRSMVINAVGVREKVDPERTPFKISPGDRILICSDGLSRMVPNKKMLAISRRHADVGEAVDALIAAALEAGGVDNVTVVLAEIGKLPEPAKALPMAESAVDFMNGDSDSGTTEGTEEETADDGQTVQTVQPIIVKAKLDLDAETVNARTDAQAGNSRKRWIAVAASAGLLLAVVAAGLAVKLWRGPARTPALEAGSAQPATTNVVPLAPKVVAEPATNAIPKVGAATTNVVPKVAPAATNAVPKVAPAATNVVPKVAPAATNAVPKVVAEPATNAIPKVAAVPVTNVVKESVSPMEVLQSAVTNAVPKVVQESVCTNLFIACEVTHIGIFTAKMRRLFPDGKPPYDYMDQVKQLEKNARECSRMHSAKTIEAVAVDMKIMLQTAEAARSAFALRAKTPEELRWLSEWDMIVSGNPKDRAVQEACARLILSAAEGRSQ